MKPISTFFIIILVLLSFRLTAQNIQFEEVKIPPFVDFDAVRNGSIAFADVDGDQDQDVLITGANYFTYISTLYINDGNGNYTEKTETPFIGVLDGALDFADVDGDQDQDVLITGYGEDNAGEVVRLYTNDGSGNFSEVFGTSFEKIGSGSVVFADVDGDQDQDVMIAGRNENGENVTNLYINDGAGSFSKVNGTTFEGQKFGDIAFEDVDGDLDKDVLIIGKGNTGAFAKLYLNDGSGTFSESLGTPFEVVYFGAIDFADVDGDQDQDVVIVGRNPNNVGTAKLYLNDGNGTFSEAPGTSFEGGYFGSVAFADIDGDSDSDLLITGADQFPVTTLSANLYLNDGNGTFTQLMGTPFEGVWEGSLAVADVDGDLDQDVILAGRNIHDAPTTSFYLNEGNSLFSQVLDKPFQGVSQSAVAFADVDGDQDQDVMITGGNNAREEITNLYVNDGFGSFSEVLGTPFERVRSGDIAFADIDRDEVDLAIYDLQGRKVAQLLHKQLPIGDHSVPVELRNIPSGILLYRLQTETKILCKRLIYLH